MRKMEKNLSVEKTRNSNIELLRVLSMLMIVAYHYSIMGFYAENIMYSANKNFVDIFGMCGKLGTNIFVMISGYYMVKSRFTVKKLLNLMGQLWFYTFAVLFVFVLVKGPGELSFQMLKYAAFPLATSHYWFASYYVLLMLLSPFINTMILNLSKKQHGFLSLFLFMLCTVMPEFFGMNFAGGSLWLLVALYISAAWIRLYVEPTDKISRQSLVAACLFLLGCALKIIISNRIARQRLDNEALIGSVDFMGAYSPFAFIIAALLLLAFCCCSPRSDKVFFVLGGCSFGVYLFHANLIVNEYLYQDILHTASYAEHPLLCLHAICAVILIYAFGTATDFLRQKSFARLWNVLMDKLLAQLYKLPLYEKTYK